MYTEIDAVPRTGQVISPVYRQIESVTVGSSHPDQRIEKSRSIVCLNILDFAWSYSQCFDTQGLFCFRWEIQISYAAASHIGVRCGL